MYGYGFSLYIINFGASIKTKKHCMFKKDYIYYIWNPATCSCKNGNYLVSIIDDLVIKCNEIIEEAKTIPTNFNEENTTWKTKNFYILLALLLITTALLITVSMYCHLKIYREKEKHFLPYYVTYNKFKKIYINNILLKTQSNNEFKEIDINDQACFHFNDIMRVGDFDIDILLDEKLYKNLNKNIFIYDISSKHFCSAKLRKTIKNSVFGSQG